MDDSEQVDQQIEIIEAAVVRLFELHGWATECAEGDASYVVDRMLQQVDVFLETGVEQEAEA